MNATLVDNDGTVIEVERIASFWECSECGTGYMIKGDAEKCCAKIVVKKS